MASINQTRAKQLGEILKDQQEPFTLELYLLEKGYKDLNKPSTSIRNKKGVILPACAKILRAIFSKLETIKVRIKHPDTRTRGFGSRKIKKGITQELGEERFSSYSSSTTVFQSCYESDTDEDENIFMQKGQSLASSKALSSHRNLPLKDEVENKQQSPISVLEVAALSDETSPVHNTQQNIKTTQEAIATRRTKRFTDKPVSSESIERKQTSVEARNKSTISSKHSSRYKKIKMALMQSKQLLFDCTREVIEKQILKTNRTKSHCFKQFVGTEDIGKLLCENIWTWNRTNSPQMLLNLDEWSSFKLQRKEVAKEIGNIIFEDFISLTVAELLQPS